MFDAAAEAVASTACVILRSDHLIELDLQRSSRGSTVTATKMSATKTMTTNHDNDGHNNYGHKK